MEKPTFTETEVNYLIYLVALITNMLTLAITAFLGAWAGFVIVAGCAIMFLLTAYRLRKP